MKREVKNKVTGYRTTDGAGVSLVRVLGHENVEEFDPILMLDSFDSTNPDDYTAGFPMHPHRGIETISYLYKGKMLHRDSLGNEDQINDGEVQWMTAGSGIIHEEQLPPADRMLGVQLWLNLPKDKKMTKPNYHSIRKDDIPEIEIDGAMIRVLAGTFKDTKAYKSENLPLDYYDIHIEENANIKLDTEHDASIMLFTLSGEVYVNDDLIKEKTAVKLTEGDTLELKTGDKKAQVLFVKSQKLDEDIAWAGPIVMNTEDELRETFTELRSGKFIKDEIDY